LIAKAPGNEVMLAIVANSQPASAPVGLRWEVAFPAEVKEFEVTAPEIGSAAKDVL
jgi:hypothetical protein